MKKINLIINLACLAIVPCITACSKSGSNLDSDTICCVEEDTCCPLYDEADYSELLISEDDAETRYQRKFDEVSIPDIHLMYADGRKIWYNPWTHETESGYMNRLYVYDSETDTEDIINLNKTSLDDDNMEVDDMIESDGKITIIMHEYRNSNGWVEGTYVWQYNCKTGSWKPLAKECSGAEFVKNGTAVKVNYAECINPDEPTFLQEYRNHYKTIPLNR